MVSKVLLVCIHCAWQYSPGIVGLTIVIQYRLVKLSDIQFITVQLMINLAKYLSGNVLLLSLMYSVPFKFER